MTHLHHNKSKNGMALIVSVLLVGVILSIAFALSAIFIPKIRSAAETKNSTPAAYAAESGLEWCLYVTRHGDVPKPQMQNDSTYEVTDCATSPIKSTGHYRGVTRAFQITL